MPSCRPAVYALALALGAAPACAQTTPGPPSLLTAEQDRFQVYAATADDLRRGVEGLEQAGREYRRYFGEEPSRIALVLYRDPAQHARYDSLAIKARGFTILRWPATAAARTQLIPWNEAGVILAPAGGCLAVRADYGAGAREGSRLQPGDVLLSVNGDSTCTPEELARVRRALGSGDEVSLRVRRADGEHVIRFAYPDPRPGRPPAEALQAAAASAPRIPTTASTIAHEAAHRLLRARFGPADLPAWFHEGFASLTEFDDSRAARLQAVRQSRSHWIPWDTLFGMAHPANSGTVVSPARPAGASPDPQLGPVQVMVSGTGGGGRSGEMYYGQSMAVLEYVANTRGERAVGELARLLASGTDPMAALTRVLGQADPAAARSAWESWLTR